jgi:hypothetical protein
MTGITVHTISRQNIKEEKNVYQPHSNNTHQQYNTSPVSGKPFYTSNGLGIKQAQT